MARHALGLDVGGSQTRWVLLSVSPFAADKVVASGQAPGFSAMQMHDSVGRAAVDACLAEVARTVVATVADCNIGAVVAGVTGVGAGSPALAALLTERFAVAESLGAVAAADAAVAVVADVEIAYRAAFAPGQGYLVYAGTGSIAAFIDSAGELRRAGGRGVALDDAGGGFWIAREALRRVWRREDERPGACRASALALALFEAVGGDSSVNAVRFLMERTRGEVGALALQVVKTAETDTIAAEILSDAGAELARLARAMHGRYGDRPIVVTGRAALMHPLVERGLRACVPSTFDVQFMAVDSTRAAARMAADLLRGRR